MKNEQYALNNADHHTTNPGRVIVKVKRTEINNPNNEDKEKLIDEVKPTIINAANLSVTLMKEITPAEQKAMEMDERDD